MEQDTKQKIATGTANLVGGAASLVGFGALVAGVPYLSSLVLEQAEFRTTQERTAVVNAVTNGAERAIDIAKPDYMDTTIPIPIPNANLTGLAAVACVRLQVTEKPKQGEDFKGDINFSVWYNENPVREKKHLCGILNNVTSDGKADLQFENGSMTATYTGFDEGGMLGRALTPNSSTSRFNSGEGPNSMETFLGLAALYATNESRKIGGLFDPDDGFDELVTKMVENYDTHAEENSVPTFTEMKDGIVDIFRDAIQIYTSETGDYLSPEQALNELNKYIDILRN